METIILLKIVHVKRLTTRQAQISKNQASQRCIICPFCLKEQNNPLTVARTEIHSSTMYKGDHDRNREAAVNQLILENNELLQ